MIFTLSMAIPGVVDGYNSSSIDNLTNISVGSGENRLSELIGDHVELGTDYAEDICFPIECDTEFILDVDDYTFSNCTFEALEGASVTIEIGNEISCVQCTFTSCDNCIASCGTTDWKGIDVPTGASLSLVNSLVEFADVGINVKTTGKIYARNTDFLDNRIGISVNTGIIMIPFIQNTFECTGSGVSCVVGINASNSTLVLGYDASVHQNSFEGLDIGITMNAK